MKIYVRKNGFEPRAFLTKAAAFDALKEEMGSGEIVEAFAWVLGGVQNIGILYDMINHISYEYCNLIIDEYLENFFDEDFDEYEVADIEDVDEWLEKL